MPATMGNSDVISVYADAGSDDMGMSHLYLYFRDRCIKHFAQNVIEH